MRKVQVEGGWWGQRADGSWLRWSPAQNDWDPSPEPPNGETSARPPVFAFPISTGTAGWSMPPLAGPVLRFVAGYLTLLVPTLVMLMLLAAFLLVMNIIFLFLFEPVDAGAFLRDASAFAAIYLVAVQAALVTIGRSPITRWWGVLGWLGAGALLTAGSMLAARVAGIGTPEGLLMEVNLWTMVGLAAIGVYSGLLRLLRRFVSRNRPSGRRLGVPWPGRLA